MYNELDYNDLGAMFYNGEISPVDFSQLEDTEFEHQQDDKEEIPMNFVEEYSFDMMPSKETLREMDIFFQRYGYLFSDIRNKSNNWKKMHGYKMTRRSGRKYKICTRLCPVDLSDFKVNKVIIDGKEFNFEEEPEYAEE